MKKMILLLFLILFLFTNGCIDSVDYNMVIKINNNSDVPETINIIVIDSNSKEIYNETHTVEHNAIEKIKDITKEEGRYSIIAFVDDDRMIKEDNIRIGSGYGPIEIYIYNEEIGLHQQQN